jgi:hypothetical protein
VTDLAIVIEPPGKTPQDKVFITHDLGNNYRVRDHFVYSFLIWIKDAFKPLIKPTDWLVAGHCHTTFLSFESRVICIGQLSPEIKAFGYTVLEVGDNVTFNLKYIPDGQVKPK